MLNLNESIALFRLFVRFILFLYEFSIFISNILGQCETRA